jgi:hypothetical protein
MKEISLTRGLVALVDDEDYESLSAYKWRVDKDGYVVRNAPHPTKPGQNTFVMMHRQILGLEFGDRRQGDHRFGRKLDNRRSELRICTGNENLRNVPKRKDNTSGFKGVHCDYRSGKWRAQIYEGGKKKSLGQYSTPEAAHAAYCAAAQQLHGEFANFG